MLIGDDGPAMSRSDEDCGKSGKVVSSKSGSSRVESRYKVDCPAAVSIGFRCQEKRRSFSLSARRGYEAPMPRGVPIGVVSAVELRPRSLVAGE